MNIKLFLFSCILFLTGFYTWAQNLEVTLCECCTYSIFHDNKDYVNVFNPITIKANNIKELTIYTTSKQSIGKTDTSLKIVDEEYKEMIFRFNSNGYVETQIVFNMKGEYHSLYEYKRDVDNRILTRTFYYLDSTGKKAKDFFPEGWIYKYANNRLIQIKKLGNKLTEDADSLSEYTCYAYNAKGRVVSEVRWAYYDWTEPYYYHTITIYNDSTNSSVSSTTHRNKLFLIQRTEYMKNQLPKIERLQDSETKKLLEETVYSYNNDGQLIKLLKKSANKRSECPDENNFENIYHYSSLGLIGSIRHHYKRTFCDLKFVYQ